LDDYFKLMDKVIALSRAGDRESALVIINEDHGTAVWLTYMELSGVIDPVIQQLKSESESAFNTLLKMSLTFQIILFAVGIPTLIYTILSLTKGLQRRRKLFMNLDEQNRKLIFDNNLPIDLDNEHQVINGMLGNLKKAAGFINGITEGNYDVKWEGYSKANSEINQHNISGALLVMREEMKKKQEEGIRQHWASEGLNKISEIIRNHQSDFELLCQHTLSFIVKYLGAQQGGFFVLNEDDERDRYIELVSCYAFSKKKFGTKRIEIGEGIVGQAFLEGQPVYLKEVPKEYVKITSGLGEANPRILTVYPMKQNEEIVGLLEIASFNSFDQHALDFLENACKSIAASIIVIRGNVKTKVLLEKAQQQTEELRAQEEEMRQNMEELQATQEEMQRREIDRRSVVEKE
jgi:putative methionine-R-sulfoxide reductase with GAF domain